MHTLIGFKYIAVCEVKGDVAYHHVVVFYHTQWKRKVKWEVGGGQCATSFAYTGTAASWPSKQTGRPDDTCTSLLDHEHKRHDYNKTAEMCFPVYAIHFLVRSKPATVKTFRPSGNTHLHRKSTSIYRQEGNNMIIKLRYTNKLAFKFRILSSRFYVNNLTIRLLPALGQVLQ